MNTQMQFISDTRGGTALSESYFVAQVMSSGNPAATAINADPTAWADTEVCMSVYNSGLSSAGSHVYIIPDFLKLQCTVVGDDSTDFYLRFVLDNKDRYSSGGTALTSKSTSIDLRTGYTNRTPKATIYFGDITANAASAEQDIDTVLVKLVAAEQAQEVGDVFYFKFGAAPQALGGMLQGTAPGFYMYPLPPVWIGRGCSMVVRPFETAAATTAAQFRISFGYYEVGHPRMTT